MTNDIFLYLIINFFSLFLIKEFLNIFFIASKKSAATIIVWIIAIGWQIFATFFAASNVIINLIISIFMILFISIGAFQGSLHKKIIFVILFNVLWMLAEILSMLFLNCIGFHFAEDSFLGSFVSKLLMFIVIKITDFWGKKRTFGEISFLTWGLMMVIPLGSILVACYIFYIDYKLYYISSPVYQTFTYLFIFLINVIIFILYEKIVAECELRRNNSIYEKQLESCKHNAMMHKQMDKELREIRHDLKYQVFYIQNALDKGMYEDALQFLQKLDYTSKIQIEKFVNTSNLLVDSLFNYEYSLAQSEGIHFSANIEISPDLFIEDGDLCLLLGNIIDNAREASIKVNSGERFIKIYMKELKKTLSLVVQNTFKNPLKRDKFGRIISSKENKSYHGVGLSTIEKITAKYNGTYMIDTKDQIFTIKVILYLS